MADDPVQAARRREQRMLARSTYFPAANLRQFEGTELSPPGGGTYYNPSRYAGAPYGNRRMAQRNLAGAYQSDLAFNVMHNPRQAQGLEAERIGAQYRGRSRVDQGGYTTINLPGGGSTTVPAREAKRILANVSGTSVLDPAKIAAEGFQKGFGATVAPQVVGGAGGDYLSRGGVMTPIENLSSSERAQYSPTFGQALFRNITEGITKRDPFYQNLAMQGVRGIGRLGTLGYNAISSLFRGTQPKFASEQGDLRRDIEGTFYGGGQAPPPTPTPTPQSQSHFLAMSQPMRYFDF